MIVKRQRQLHQKCVLKQIDTLIHNKYICTSTCFNPSLMFAVVLSFSVSVLFLAFHSPQMTGEVSAVNKVIKFITSDKI